jgi:hypothetical protein
MVIEMKSVTLAFNHLGGGGDACGTLVVFLLFNAMLNWVCRIFMGASFSTEGLFNPFDFKVVPLFSSNVFLAPYVLGVALFSSEVFLAPWILEDDSFFIRGLFSLLLFRGASLFIGGFFSSLYFRSASFFFGCLF